MASRKLLSGALGAALAALFSAASIAQSPDLALTIDLGKAEIAVGEPVYAIATLTNVSAQPVEGFFDVSPESGGMSVEIDRDGAHVSNFAPLAVDDVDRPRVTLQPGESLGGAFQIFYGARGWTFSSPGAYQVRVLFAEPGAAEPVVAMPVELEVIEDSVGRTLVDDAAGDAGKFMAWLGGDHLQSARRQLDNAARSSSTSPVAMHARWILGESLSRPFRNYVENTIRPPQPEASLELLDSVDLNALAPFAQMMLHTARARDYALLGDTTARDEAIASARDVVAAHPSLADQTATIVEEIEGMIVINPANPPG